MIYKRNKNLIEKYEVIIDKEQIEEIRLEIINNCSYIEHHEYQTTLPYKYDKDPLKYRNYHFKQLGWREFRDGPDEMEYLVSYDEYIFPDIIKDIDQLLNGNETVIDKLNNYKEKKINFNKKIEEKSKELDQIDNLNIKAKKKVLEELEELLKKKDLHKDKNNIEYYLPKLRNCIKLKLIDTINYDEVKKVDDFYSNTLSLKL